MLSLSLVFVCLFVFVLPLPIFLFARIAVKVLTSSAFDVSNPVCVVQWNEKSYLWGLIAGPESTEPILILRRRTVPGYREVRSKRKKEKKKYPCLWIV